MTYGKVNVFNDITLEDIVIDISDHMNVNCIIWFNSLYPSDYDPEYTSDIDDDVVTINLNINLNTSKNTNDQVDRGILIIFQQ